MLHLIFVLLLCFQPFMFSFSILTFYSFCPNISFSFFSFLDIPKLNETKCKNYVKPQDKGDPCPG